VISPKPFQFLPMTQRDEIGDYDKHYLFFSNFMWDGILAYNRYTKNVFQMRCLLYYIAYEIGDSTRTFMVADIVKWFLDNKDELIEFNIASVKNYYTNANPQKYDSCVALATKRFAKFMIDFENHYHIYQFSKQLDIFAFTGILNLNRIFKTNERRHYKIFSIGKEGKKLIEYIRQGYYVP